MEKLRNLSEDFLENIWQMYGDSVESDTFYGDFMVKSVWRLFGVFIEELWKIKLQPTFIYSKTQYSYFPINSFSLENPKPRR